MTNVQEFVIGRYVTTITGNKLPHNIELEVKAICAVGHNPVLPIIQIKSPYM